jgi:hypothetical protein
LQFSKEYELKHGSPIRIEQVVSAMATLLDWSDSITQGHIDRRNGLAWPIHQQLMHTTSECGEAYEAMRKQKCNTEVMQEFIDIIFAGFTNINIHKRDRLKSMSFQQHKDLFRGSVATVAKRLEKRINQKNYVVERY